MIPVAQLPSCLWQNDVLHVSNDIQEVYEAHLRSLGLFEKALSYEGKRGIHGGESKEETHEHFCLRFINSVARVQCVLLDPMKVFEDIPSDLLLTLSSHRISLLDLACGAGAGTISALITLKELRQAKLLPIIPLSLRILGADFSAHALELYESQIKQLKPRLAKVGISVNLETRRWDARNARQTNQLIDDYLEGPQAYSELLVLVAAISGASKADFQDFTKSIELLWIRLSSVTTRSSTILWIEPNTSNGKNLLKKLRNFVKPWLWFQSNQAANEEKYACNYNLFIKLNNKNVKSGVMVHRFTRNYKE
jgi:hypothetical protein